MGFFPFLGGVLKWVIIAFFYSLSRFRAELFTSPTLQIVSLTAQANTLFSAAAVAHPSMLSPDEAPAVTIPFCMLASKGEDPGAVKAYEQGLVGEKYFETFTDQAHGWMGAR